jgi:hypothetical protein
MLPENNSGKDDETVERTHNTKMAKQREEPGDEKRTSTVTLDNIATDKIDPTIGSTRVPTREKQQDRNLNVNTEPILMKSSILKFNRGEHPMSTKETEHYDIKQADKDKESQEIPRHPSNYVANITWTNRHTTKQQVPTKSIDTSTAPPPR